MFYIYAGKRYIGPSCSGLSLVYGFDQPTGRRGASVMKTEQLYQHLIELAEKLDITVREQKLKPAAGVKVSSGLCTLRGKRLFIMDKRKSLRTKVETLAACLSRMPLEEIYIIPAVRNILEKQSPNMVSRPVEGGMGKTS